MTTNAPRNREELTALAKAMRRRLDTLYVQGGVNDPWMVGQDFRSKPAHWASSIFDRLQILKKIHVREVFYKLVSQKQPVAKVDGTSFVNDSDHYNNLCDNIRDARYLGLIGADAIIDRRNPEPVINCEDDGDIAAEIEVERGRVVRHSFGVNYFAPSLVLPQVLLTQEPHIGQRYHIEIWIEKSTANEVLMPLSRQYGINVATFIGEVSATACKNLVNRAIASGRPVRILHVTDFDPAGRDMPISAARKIDFFVMQSGIDLDIRLEPVALTQEQCIRYQLPRTPIKKSETRLAGFEARFGEGATELDALEALHPGALREILVEHIERYYDHDIARNVDAAVARFEEELAEAASNVRDDHEEELAAIREMRDLIDARFDEVGDAAQADYDAVVEPARQAYEAVLAQAEADRQAALEQVRPQIEEMEKSLVEKAEPLLETMSDELILAAPDPELYDWPEPAEGDEDDAALYDSTRDYVEQVDIFRAHQGKGDEYVGLAADRKVAKTCKLCGKSFNAPNPKRIFCSSSCTNKSSRLSVQSRRDAGSPQAGKVDDTVESA